MYGRRSWRIAVRMLSTRRLMSSCGAKSFTWKCKYTSALAFAFKELLLSAGSWGERDGTYLSAINTVHGWDTKQTGQKCWWCGATDPDVQRHRVFEQENAIALQAFDREIDHWRQNNAARASDWLFLFANRLLFRKRETSFRRHVVQCEHSWVNEHSRVRDRHVVELSRTRNVIRFSLRIPPTSAVCFSLTWYCKKTRSSGLRSVPPRRAEFLSNDI